MSSQNLASFSLSLFSIALLSACGGGGSDTTPVNAGNNVNDNSPPSLSLRGANPQYIALNSSFTDLGANAFDVVDGNLSNSVSETNNVNMALAGCYKQSYQVTDNSGNSSTTTRTIFVGNDIERRASNNAPYAQEDSITTVYNETSRIYVLDNDDDSDNANGANCDSLSVISVSQPNIGTARLNRDGSITYNPLGNVGSHFFTYTVADSYGATDIAGVSIASQDPNDGNDSWPTITGETVVTSKNTSILINVLANDFDADNDTLILDGIDDPAHGFVQKVNGQILYTPDLGYTGQDSFYYGVHDNYGHNGSGLVEITITD